MILAVRTSSGPYGVGLFSEAGSLIAFSEAEVSPVRSGNVGDVFRETVEKSRHLIPEISEIVVDLGPGGLTSTRVGVSFANALSFGIGAKLYGVSALELQFQDARLHSVCPILSLRPALGRRVLWALYERDIFVEHGYGLAQEVVEKLALQHEKLLVIGPLRRCTLNTRGTENVKFFELDTPSIRSLLMAHKVSPNENSAISFLEPITSFEGLRGE